MSLSSWIAPQWRFTSDKIINYSCFFIIFECIQAIEYTYKQNNCPHRTIRQSRLSGLLYSHCIWINTSASTWCRVWVLLNSQTLSCYSTLWREQPEGCMGCGYLNQWSEQPQNYCWTTNRVYTTMIASLSMNIYLLLFLQENFFNTQQHPRVQTLTKLNIIYY